MFSVYLTVVMVAMVTAQSEDTPRTYCGRVLATAQSVYCAAVEHTNQKKSGDTTQIGTKGNDAWPWLARRNAYSLATVPRPKRFVGLVDECCFKPCYLSELLSFC